MSFAVAETERRLANVVRIGRVASIDASAATARVDLGGITTPDIPVGQLRAGAVRLKWMPSPGEQVLIAAPSGDLAQAVIVCSIFASNAPGGSDPSINLGGGTLVIDGDLQVTGDVEAGGISLRSHTHDKAGIGNETKEPTQ